MLNEKEDDIFKRSYENEINTYLCHMRKSGAKK